MASEERAALVVELVRRLVAEVHPHASRLNVTLDSTFEDLGIGSLELVELLHRVQDAFGVALPAHVLASAETPHDLLQAVTRSHARVGEDLGVVSPPAPVAGGPAPAPAAASTLIDALDWHVGATPERTHIRILDESGSPDDMNYKALHREAAGVAAGLLARDVMPGDTVAIMLPTSRRTSSPSPAYCSPAPCPYPSTRRPGLPSWPITCVATPASWPMPEPRCSSPCPRPCLSATCCAPTSTACATSSSPNP